MNPVTPINQREAIELGCERVDRTWEQQNADQRREQWAEERRALTRSLRATREAQPLHQRLYAAEAHIARITTVKAQSFSPTPRAGLSDDRFGPPPADRDALGQQRADEIGRCRGLIAKHITRLEEIIDEHRGLGSARDYARMTTDEKDKLIWDEYQGIRAEQVAQEAPWLGTSARTIERARAREAERRHLRVRLVDGEVLGRDLRAA